MNATELTPGAKALADAVKGGGFDITNEARRFYTYPGGDTFEIDSPVALYIVNGSHRVVDSNGITHRPERGYVGISWEPKPGAPAYDF